MRCTAWILIALISALPVVAQDDGTTAIDEEIAAWEGFLESLDWSSAGETGLMGTEAQIQVPAGYVFTGRDGTQGLMEAFGNLLTDRELGFIAPMRQEGELDFSWFAVFEFDPIGYVKDDDKESLDADAMMESMLESQEAANEQRSEMGYETLHITGWAHEPSYNEVTNNLEWAINLRSGDGMDNVNLNTRLLGRKGVMKVTLVCDPVDLEATIPAYQTMLESFDFQDGNRYAEFKKGDKLAKVGLAGLVVGGGAAVLAKTGILQKLLKPLLVGLVAIGAFLKRFLFGRSKGDDAVEDDS